MFLFVYRFQKAMAIENSSDGSTDGYEDRFLPFLVHLDSANGAHNSVEVARTVKE
jgi:hypothetical protein